MILVGGMWNLLPYGTCICHYAFFFFFFFFFVPVHSIFIFSLIRYRSGRQNGW